MRSILMIVIITLCAIGCSTKDEGGTDDHNDHSTTLEEKESTLIAAVTKKQEQSLPKTWQRTRLVLHEGYELVDSPVELDLDELHFKQAFSIQYRAKGEGHTFWWRGDEYTTNLEEYGKAKEYPSVDKE